MSDDQPNGWYYFTLVTQLGLVVVITILVGFGLGFWIDQKFNTSPTFVILFLVVGVAAGLYNAYQMIMRYMK